MSMDNPTQPSAQNDPAVVKYHGPIKHIEVRDRQWFVAYENGVETGPFANAWLATRSAPRDLRIAYFGPNRSM